MASRKRIEKEQRIGVTESGEIAFNLEAFDRLYKGNLIITKRLTEKVIEKLVEHQDKIILHLTVTGMGGSRIEPFVPRAVDTHKMLVKLLEAGFPVSHVVLRVDPIVPTERGMETALDVIAAFGGHAHIDYSFNTPGGIPVILTTCDSDIQESGGLTRTRGTTTEQAFDVVLINYDTRTIKLVRVGAGSDRTFTY